MKVVRISSDFSRRQLMEANKGSVIDAKGSLFWPLGHSPPFLENFQIFVSLTKLMKSDQSDFWLGIVETIYFVIFIWISLHISHFRIPTWIGFTIPSEGLWDSWVLESSTKVEVTWNLNQRLILIFLVLILFQPLNGDYNSSF